MGRSERSGWLSLGDAAEKLGVSRLRLREGIAAGAIPARRDNRGMWRVALDDVPDGYFRRTASIRLEPPDMVQLLFDEIEELNLVLEDRNAQIDRLTTLLARHGTLLDKALTLAESSRSREARGDGESDRLASVVNRSDALMERTIGALEKRESDLTRMTALMDRSLLAMKALDAEATRQSEAAAKQRAMLERTFAVAQKAVEAVTDPRRAGGLFARIRSLLVKGGAR